MIDEALKTMSPPISSINFIKVYIDYESDFKILERFSEKAKRVEVFFDIHEIEEIYEPN
jgi:hypothetical protein